MTDEQNDKRFELDPKIAARNERYTPEVEKLLRLNMDLDGPKGTSKKFRDNYDAVFKKKPHPYEPDEAEVEKLETAIRADLQANKDDRELARLQEKHARVMDAVRDARDSLDSGQFSRAREALARAINE